MKADFGRVMAIVFRFEGGYTAGIGDPGGETNLGISKRSYPTEDVRSLAVDRASQLYYRDYWKPLNGNLLPWPLCLVVMDAGVNHGLKRARAFLGETHDATEYLNRREAFYHRLVEKKPHLQKFLRGWLRRVSVLRQEVTKP